MRLGNGTGSIVKLKKNLRKPYMVRLPAAYEYDPTAHTVKENRKVLGYYATKKDALIALSEYLQDPFQFDNNDATFARIWNVVRDSLDISAERIATYESLFNRRFDSIRNMRISEIKTAKLQNIIDTCPDGAATKTKIAAIMHKTFRYAIQNGYITTDYSQYVTVKREPTKLRRIIFTSEEIAELYELNDQFSVFTLLLLYSGCRLKELRDLKKEDVDLQGGFFAIRQGKNAAAIRSVPIHPAVLNLWTDLYRNTDNDSYLFPFSKNQYDWWMKNHYHHTPYDTRHTFATVSQKCGMRPLYVQKIMGHTPQTVLEQVYTHITIEELQEEIQLLVYQ